MFVYSRPFGSEKHKIDFEAQAYVYPFFHQNWNLFVPVPDCNYKLYCIYNDNGKNVTDVFAEIKIKHQTNRLKGYEPLLIAFSNSIHFFEKNTKQQEVLNGPIIKDISFEIIEKAAKNYLQYSRNIKIEKLKIIIAVQQTFSNKQRIYFN